MNVVTRSILICIAACSLSATAQELETDNTVDSVTIKPLLAGGFTIGGDNLVEVEYEDGSSDELDAGDLLDLKAGFLIDLHNYPITIQTTIGYHFDSVDAENGDASFNRLPLDLLAFYNIDKHRIGAGLSYHLNPELELEFGGVNIDIDADNAMGLVLEYGNEVADNIIVGLRYVDIEYEFEGSSEKFDGSHVGIYGYFTF